jgi:two-component system, NarL family, nitrate/nitrite response regulator NarL
MSRPKPLRLVLADDHRLLIECMTVALKASGHRVVGLATTPHEAMTVVSVTRPDVCLLDLHFRSGRGENRSTFGRNRCRSGSAVARPSPWEPDVDSLQPAGMQIAARMRHEQPDTKVLILSADRDPSLADRALSAGASGFVRKDQRLVGVLYALDALARGDALPERLAGAQAVPRARQCGIDGGADRSGVDHGGDGRITGQRFGLSRLTGREREVLRRIVDGESTAQIASGLDIAASTARSHVQNVLVKLGVRSRLQAAALVSGAVEGAVGGPMAPTLRAARALGGTRTVPGVRVASEARPDSATCVIPRVLAIRAASEF